jgi:hypothetical protein
MRLKPAFTLQQCAHHEIALRGGGSGWLKYPNRCHRECLEDYFQEEL